jgi:hypothetical protein
MKVNPLFEAVSAWLITDMSPDAPLPITAVMLVDDVTLNEAAGFPPKLTDEVLNKLFPVMVTVAPSAAEDGEKLVITGARAGLVCRMMIL